METFNSWSGANIPLKESHSPSVLKGYTEVNHWELLVLTTNFTTSFGLVTKEFSALHIDHSFFL